ncbi:MAG: DMT family transporter [Chloroflexi bacterium]|nr:DMT family transporter [Chloroflexota bacterium]
MLGYLGLSLTVVFWGASFVALKVLLRELGPAAITVARFGVGMVFLWIVSAARGHLQRPTKRELPWLAGLGFSGIVLHQWLQSVGLQTASATVTSWIVASIPVFVALLGWVVLREPMGRGRVSGIVLAAGGVTLVVSGGDLRGLIAGTTGTPGDILIVFSAVNWAAFTILSKRFMQTSSLRPATMMLYVMGIGWLYSLAWLGVEGGGEAVQRLSAAGWWAIGFLGLACSGLAYLFWYDALDRIDATQAGAFLYFGPLVTAALAWPILGEPIGAAMLAGGAAILIGVWLVNRQPRRTS